jgi:hypothetical protein
MYSERQLAAAGRNRAAVRELSRGRGFDASDFIVAGNPEMRERVNPVCRT